MTFTNGEVVRLDADWTVMVFQASGHSWGHLSLYDTRNSVLFAGDAVQHASYRGLDGTVVLTRTYLRVDLYLNTIRQFERLSPSRAIAIKKKGLA